MEVLIASESLAYCEWLEGAVKKRGIFKQDRLHPCTPQAARDPSRAV